MTWYRIRMTGCPPAAGRGVSDGEGPSSLGVAVSPGNRRWPLRDPRRGVTARSPAWRVRALVRQILRPVWRARTSWREQAPVETPSPGRGQQTEHRAVVGRGSRQRGRCQPDGSQDRAAHEAGEQAVEDLEAERPGVTGHSRAKQIHTAGRQASASADTQRPGWDVARRRAITGAVPSREPISSPSPAAPGSTSESGGWPRRSPP